MIYGIGTDIAEVKRFDKWIKNPELIERFFNKNEYFEGNLSQSTEAQKRHYASRFASKEAFSKALGTGFVDLTLKDFYVSKNEEGKPYFVFEENLLKKIKDRIGKNFNIQLSISHEKEYAVAFVIIEILS